MSSQKDIKLETYLKHRLESRDILLMTHIVIGYPSFEDSLKIVEAMVGAGVDLIELQIPCSDPIADGPVIRHANQRALDNDASVERCFEFADQVSDKYNIPFLFVTYYQILFKYGVKRFVERMATTGLQGAIVPDLPPDLDDGYLQAMVAERLSPIFIFTPATSNDRMRHLASVGKGMIYCASRKGATGASTLFSSDFDAYMARCRRATELPLAVGFGVKTADDIDQIRGKADIAVIGTRIIELLEQNDVSALVPFIRGLRSNHQQ